MEQSPRRSPDEEPHGPEEEQLYLGEIDLTGVVRQDDELRDVIHDAIAEAEADKGEVPEWGARSLARALANERDDPLSGALHRFAATGRVDPEAIYDELAETYERADDETVKEWANWLGTYVVRQSAETASQPDPEHSDIGRTPDTDTPTVAPGLPLPEPFAGDYTPGEVLNIDDARSLATVLSMFLDRDSELARFADTGDANPVQLHDECQEVRRRVEHVPGADTWVTALEQHLAARSDLGRQSTRPSAVDTPGENSMQIEQGINEHGDAFRAFLQVGGIDHTRNDLLQAFLKYYVGTYDSAAAFAADLNSGLFREQEQMRLFAAGQIDDYVARIRFDVIRVNDKLYIFGR